ncbi:MAG TPA: hypothetical protein VN259_11115 [Xanthomonadales bacterium]|nr:hypothetical protein [Xanthomonadales bacterium]
MNDQGESGWIAQVREQLDVDVRDLDAATASRLNRARQTALDVGLRQRRSRGWWLPFALATATALVLALTVTLRSADPLLQAPTLAAPAAADDFELLAGGEDLEMIEDLEFYAWLEQQSLDG